MKQKTRRRLQNLCVIILILLGFFWVGWKFLGFTSSTYTDNAQVDRQIVPVNSRVQGYIEEVLFDDYQFVDKGDTLVIIDDAEYKLRVAQARADLANVKSGKSTINSSLTTIGSSVDVNKAAMVETKALLDNAEADLQRYQALLDKKAVTRQEYDAVKTQRDALKARYEMQRKQAATTSLSGEEQRTRLDQNAAATEMAQAALDLAELNLGYTVITAPVSGWVQRRTIEPGQFVQPGQLLVDIVDASDIWIIANYKEKQTARMQVGDTVKVKVDAVPDEEFKGVITEMAQTTGARAMGKTSDNAVGNFVKIQQRIPVKIRLLPGKEEKVMSRLRAGMNAEVKLVD